MKVQAEKPAKAQTPKHSDSIQPYTNGTFLDVCCETGVLAQKKVGRARLTDSLNAKFFKTDRLRRERQIGREIKK